MFLNLNFEGGVGILLQGLYKYSWASFDDNGPPQKKQFSQSKYDQSLRGVILSYNSLSIASKQIEKIPLISNSEWTSCSYSSC